MAGITDKQTITGEQLRLALLVMKVAIVPIRNWQGAVLGDGAYHNPTGLDVTKVFAYIRRLFGRDHLACKMHGFVWKLLPFVYANREGFRPSSMTLTSVIEVFHNNSVSPFMDEETAMQMREAHAFFLPFAAGEVTEADFRS